jgi:hypothetical protein
VRQFTLCGLEQPDGTVGLIPIVQSERKGLTDNANQGDVISSATSALRRLRVLPLAVLPLAASMAPDAPLLPPHEKSRSNKYKARVRSRDDTRRPLSADPPRVRRKKEAELQRRRGLWRPTICRSAEGTTATLVPLARYSTCRLCPNCGSESRVGDPAANHLSQVWEGARGSMSAGSVNNARRYPVEITPRRQWSWSAGPSRGVKNQFGVEPSRSEREREDL